MIVFASQQLTNGNALDETKMPKKIEMSRCHAQSPHARTFSHFCKFQRTIFLDQLASLRVAPEGLPQRLRVDIGYRARMSSKVHSFGVGTTLLWTAYCYLYLSIYLCNTDGS